MKRAPRIGMKRAVLAVSVLMLAGMQVSCSKIAGPAADLFISDQEEIQMGANFDAEIRKDPQYKVSTNAALRAYIDSIGARVATAQNQRTNNGQKFPFQFEVLDDTSINAFAVPGGYVYVNTGLVSNASSEEEIAGVIAHEVAHVTNRHGAENMIEQQGLGFVLQLVGINPDSSVLAGALTSLLFLKYSRDHEYQSDSCGAEFMARTSWNPDGLESFFNVLISKYGDGMGGFEVLSTHPATSDRITRVRSIVGSMSSTIKNRPSYAIRVKP